jgi:murein DD-endopeptidase MepM/ murein hydrolase activator NlpD
MTQRILVRSSIVLLITLLFLGIGIVLASDEVSDEIYLLNSNIEQKQQSIDQISRQIDTYNTLIDQKQAEEASLNLELELLDNRVKKTELQIIQTEQEIDLVNEEMHLIELEIHGLEKKLSIQQEIMADILREIQIVDNNLPFESLFGSNSLAELFNEIEQLESVNSKLNEAVHLAQVAKTDLLKKREDVNQKKGKLQELGITLNNEIELLKEEEKSKEVLISATQRSEAEFQLLLNQLRQEEAFINQQINLLQAEIEGKLSANDEVGDSSILSWPVSPTGYGISAYFHDPTYPFRHLFEHSGIDLPSPTGTAIGAAAPGYVAWTRVGRLYGNYVMIIHTNGVATLYAHMSRIDVSPDQFVTRGQTIGAVGNTGLSTGPHLHFEVRKNGIPTNPLNYLIAY